MTYFGIDSEHVSGIVDGTNKEIGRTNIIIAGRSGVGKSTMVNAIFKKEVAKTGTGSPVTEKITEYPVEGTRVSLFDTRGIEMADYQQTVNELHTFIQKRRQDTDPNNHIHIAWMCILEGSNRFEEGEISVIETLQKYMPVIIVICQSYSDNQSIITTIKNRFPELKIIPIIAKEKAMRGNVTIQAMGLPELVEATIELLPEANQKAFAAAQQASLKTKQTMSHVIVASAATLAAVAGATPIPFSDAAALIPIQITMISGITAVFGFKLDRSVIMALWGSFVTAAGATGIGLLLASLLKFIPGVGTIAGGVIDATIASSLTTGFGEAYIAILTKVFEENNGIPPTSEQLVAKCKETWKKKLST